MWRVKAIKWAWITLACNAGIAVMNLAFSHGHWLKHEYWLMSFSVALVLLNTWVAVWQYKTIRKYRKEINELVWKMLATPSEQLR